MKLIRHMLKQYPLVEAASAEQALHRFKDDNGNIGLLISDVTLPISTGVQLALRLRHENPELPVILTSGYPVSGWSAQDATDLQRLGSDSVTVLQKPFERQVLLHWVSEFIGLPQSQARTT